MKSIHTLKLGASSIGATATRHSEPVMHAEEEPAPAPSTPSAPKAVGSRKNTLDMPKHAGPTR